MVYEIITVLRYNLFCHDCFTAGMCLHPSPDTGMVCNIYMEEQCKSDAKFETCHMCKAGLKIACLPSVFL